MALTTQAVPPRRGRGRPPKLQTVTAGRGRGRPPKLQSATVRHLGRGRPPKLLVKLPRRGRGRPPKQSTQHASQLPATPGTSGMQSSKAETPRQGTAGTDDPGGGSGTTTAGTSHQVRFALLTHWGRDKWTPFRRRHFQMNFLEWKCLNSD